MKNVACLYMKFLCPLPLAALSSEWFSYDLLLPSPGLHLYPPQRRRKFKGPPLYGRVSSQVQFVEQVLALLVRPDVMVGTLWLPSKVNWVDELALLGSIPAKSPSNRNDVILRVIMFNIADVDWQFKRVCGGWGGGGKIQIEPVVNACILA